MDRREKEQVVADMHEAFKGATLVVLTHQSGLSVGESTELRRRVHEAGSRFKVTKNRLAKLAIKGTDYEALEDYFTGPTAAAFSPDAVSAAKVLTEYAKKNQKVQIIGGALGPQVLDPEGVKNLAELPSLDELRGKLVGILQQPAAKMVGVLEAPGGQLARVLRAYADKHGEAA